MLNRLNNWADRTTRTRRSLNASHANKDKAQLPVHPPPGPRPLTPTSSPQCPDQLQSIPKATANSPFFQRLPADIRRLILIEAFGERTIHMAPLHDKETDLDQLFFYTSYISSCMWEVRRTIDPAGHCGILMPDKSSRPSPLARLLGRKSMKKTTSWEWRSSLCHRDAEWRMRRNHDNRLVSDPWRDTCCEGVARCGEWAGEGPGKCAVGVMGWLGACQLAYIEGIEILYATNTIHMASSVMMLDLSRILLLQQLEMISSVEMVWRIPPPSEDADSPDSGKGLFATLLRSTPKSLPNLRRLSVSIMWDPIVGIYHAGEEAVRRIMNEIVLPVDGMVREFGPQLRECNVVIYARLWRALNGGGRPWDEVVWEDSKVKGVGDRYWRPLVLDLEGEGEPAGPEGYWICEGYDDSPRYPFAHVNPDYDWDPVGY